MNPNPRPSEPWTIHRLKTLKPGETFRYYRGSDKEAALNEETMAYSSVLGQVFDTAKRLNEWGRIEIRIKDVWINVRGMASPIKVTDYIAIGAPAK